MKHSARRINEGYLKMYTPDGHYIWVNQDRDIADNKKESPPSTARAEDDAYRTCETPQAGPDSYKPERIPAALSMVYRSIQREVSTEVMEDMKPYIVEHNELKLIGIPCISLQDMSGKYHHAKEALLSSAKHLPSVKNPSVHYGIWPQASTQRQSDMHAYILCMEVESFHGVPEWYFQTILPPQTCVVVPNRNGDFQAASEAVEQFLHKSRLQVGADDRKYTICERYNYEGEGFSRYSLPIQSGLEDSP